MNYLGMKKSKAVSQAGVIDNEAALLQVTLAGRSLARSIARHFSYSRLISKLHRILRSCPPTSLGQCYAYTCSATCWTERSASRRWCADHASILSTHALYGVSKCICVIISAGFSEMVRRACRHLTNVQYRHTNTVYALYVCAGTLWLTKATS